MASTIPPAGSGNVPPVQPQSKPSVEGNDQATKKTPLLVGRRPRSNSLPEIPKRGLHQRTFKKISPDELLPVIKQPASFSSPEKAKAIEKAQKVYDKQAEAYRQVHAQKWLVDNQKYIKQCLNNSKHAQGAKFKLYIVIDGKKHQVIPESSSIPEGKQKNVRSYIKQALDQSVRELPKQKKLAGYIDQFSKPLASSYSQLVNLGAPPPFHPKEDLAHSGIRVDIEEDTWKVRSYHLDENDTKSNDEELDFSPENGIEFEDVDLSEQLESEEE